MTLQQRPQQRIGAQVIGDQLRVRIQVEHPSHALHQRLRMGRGLRAEMQSEFQRGLVVQRTDAEPAAVPAQVHAAAVAAWLQALDAGQGAEGEVGVELLPVPRGEVGQAQGLRGIEDHVVHGRTITAGRPAVLPQLTFKSAARFDLSSPAA
ncbi:hypothetical protein D9M70_571230 [compost metagenome]